VGLLYPYSPGVEDEISISSSIAKIPASFDTIGIVGSANTGTAGTAYLIKTYDEAVTTFGATSRIVEHIAHIFRNFDLRAAAIVAVPAGAPTAVTGGAGTGDGTHKIYTFANKDWDKNATTKVYKNGTQVTTGFTIDHINGVVTFVAANQGTDTVTADYSYHPADSAYATALNTLALEEAIRIVLLDNSRETLHDEVVSHLATCAADDKERMAIIGALPGKTKATIKTLAHGLNNGRIMLVPAPIDTDGNAIAGSYLAAAFAARDSQITDPALPRNFESVIGFGGLEVKFNKADTDELLGAGVAVCAEIGGKIEMLRSVTTYSYTGSDVPDNTYREWCTNKSADYVARRMRARARGVLAKHRKDTPATREILKTELTMEMESFVSEEIILRELDANNNQISPAEITISEDPGLPGVLYANYGGTLVGSAYKVYLTGQLKTS
jgi:hypothetical protein